MRAFLSDWIFNLTYQALQLFPVSVNLSGKRIRVTGTSGHRVAWFCFGECCNCFLTWFGNTSTPWCNAGSSDFDLLVKWLCAIFGHHLARKGKVGNGVFRLFAHKRHSVCACWDRSTCLALRCLLARKTAQHIHHVLAGFFVGMKTFFQVKSRTRTG